MSSPDPAALRWPRRRDLWRRFHLSRAAADGRPTSRAVTPSARGAPSYSRRLSVVLVACAAPQDQFGEPGVIVVAGFADTQPRRSRSPRWSHPESSARRTRSCRFSRGFRPTQSARPSWVATSSGRCALSRDYSCRRCGMGRRIQSPDRGAERKSKRNPPRRAGPKLADLGVIDIG